MSPDTPDAAAAAPNEPASRRPEASQRLEPGAAWDDLESPLWEGIPREVIERVGAYDTDTAGGCG